MRRSLNYKFLLGLLAGTAVFGTGVHFLHAYQVRRNAGALLTRAEQAEKAGDNAQALDYYRRYLGFVPKDTEALARYGLLLADEKVATTPRKRIEALLVLDRVLGQEPGRDEVRRKAVTLAMSVGRYGDALVHLDGHLIKSHPEDGQLQALKGQCLEGQGKYELARTAYEQAIQLDRAQVETYGRLAFLLRLHPVDVMKKDETQAKLPAKADQVMERMVARNPRAFKAYLFRADYRRRFTPRRDAAWLTALANDVEQARKLAPDEVEVALALAQLAQDQGDPDKARTYLAQGCRKHPQAWRLYQALARLEKRLGRTAAAADCLRAGLKELPEQVDLLWDLADALVQQKARQELTEVVDRLKKLGFEQAELDLFNARLLVLEGKRAKAARLLEDIYPRLQGRLEESKNAFFADLVQQSDLLLAGCYEQDGDVDRAEAAFGRVVTRDAGSVPGRLGLVAARLNRRMYGEALLQYRQLMGLPNAPANGWFEIARITFFRNLEREKPRWGEVYEALAEAERQAAARNEGVPVGLLLLRVETLLRENPPKYDEARKRLDAVLEGPRPPSVLWVALAALEERQGKAEAALAVLDRAEKRYGDDVELRLGRGRYWVGRGGAPARAALVKLSRKVNNFSEADRYRLLSFLAQALAQVGAPDEAKSLWARLAAQRADDLVSRQALFDLAMLKGDDRALERLTAEIRAIEGDEGVGWRHAEVRRLIRQASRAEKAEDRASLLAEARRHLAKVADRRPRWSQVALCAGQINDLLGKPEQALVKYREAIDRGSRGTGVLRRTVELLHAQQRDHEAAELLRKLPRDTLVAEGMEQTAATVFLAARENNQALDLADPDAAKGSKDYRDFLWRGQVYWAANKPDAAGPLLEKARDLADTAPETWTTLILFLANTGQKEKAREAIAAAEKKLPPDKKPLALGRCYQAVGDTEKADKSYAAALAARPDDLVVRRSVAIHYMATKRLKEAQAHLEYISTAGKKRSPRDAAWAQRIRAVLMAVGGDYEQTREALALLGEGELENDAGGEAIQDRRAKAILLASGRSRKEHHEAIKILKNLVDRSLAGPEDHLLLANLYERVGDWRLARQQFVTLTSLSGGGTPAILASFALGLLRHEELEAAEEVLTRLEKSDPKGAATVEVKARVLHKQGKGKDAVALLKEYAGVEGANLARVAAVLEDLRETAAAEEMYRDFARQPNQAQAAGVVALVGFYVRQKELDKALVECKRVGRKASPEVVAQACMVVLGGKPAESTREQLVSLLQAALKKNRESTALAFTLGHIRTVQGRDKEAVEIYRRALARNGRDATALNNLACLLAMQKGGNAVEALELVERAYNIVGPHSALMDTKGVVLLCLGQSEEAIRILKKVVEEEPARAVSHFHLAQAYHAAKKQVAAVRSLRKAQSLGLQPENLNPLERPAHARLLRELGLAKTKGR
jgi:tetratricopeptide (TPR) repeat protein